MLGRCPNAVGEGRAEKEYGGRRDMCRELLPFFNVRCGQEVSFSW